MRPHENHTLQKRFIVSIILTSVILLAEVAGGLWTGSLALLSDSAHVFTDIFALGLSYLALRLSSLPADEGHSYGYHRLEVLAALANGISLGIISIGIFVEAYNRWLTPEPIKSVEMLVIAAIGLIANILVAVVLKGHSHSHEHDQSGHHHEALANRDLNLESAFLHVIGDAISSVGVIVAAILIWRTGYMWIDPLVSVLIGLIILFSSVRVLRSSLHILIEGVPEGMSISRIGESIASVPGVQEVHDLHVWNICSGTVALSAHVVLSEETARDSGPTMAQVKDCLATRYGIDHTTVQFECKTCGQGSSLRENVLSGNN